MGYLRCLVSSTVKERTSRMRRLNRFEIDWRGKLTGWSAPPGVNTGRLAGRLHCGGEIMQATEVDAPGFVSRSLCLILRWTACV